MTITTTQTKTNPTLFSSHPNFLAFFTDSMDTFSKIQSVRHKIINPEYKTSFDRVVDTKNVHSSAKKLSNYHQSLFDALKSRNLCQLPSIVKEEKKLSKNPGFSYCCEEAFDFLVANKDIFSSATELQMKNFLLAHMCWQAFQNRIHHLNNSSGAFDPKTWEEEAFLAFTTNPEQIEPFFPYTDTIDNRAFYARSYEWNNGNFVLSWNDSKLAGYGDKSYFNAWKDGCIRNSSDTKGIKEFYHRLDLERRIGLSCEKDSNKESVALKKQICFLMQIFNRYFLLHSKNLDIGHTLSSKPNRFGPTSKIDKKDLTKHSATLKCLEKLIVSLIQRLQSLNSTLTPSQIEALNTNFSTISTELKKHDPIAAALVLDGKIPPDDVADGKFLTLPFINIFEPLSAQINIQDASSSQEGKAYSEQYVGFSLTSLIIGGILAPITGGLSLALGAAASVGGLTIAAVNHADGAPKGEGISSFFSGVSLAATIASSGAAIASAKAIKSTEAAIASARASSDNLSTTKPPVQIHLTKPPSSTLSQSSSQQKNKATIDKNTIEPKIQTPSPKTTLLKSPQTLDSSESIKILLAQQKKLDPSTQLKAIRDFIQKEISVSHPLQEIIKPKETINLISPPSFKTHQQDRSDYLLFRLQPKGNGNHTEVFMKNAQSSHRVVVNTYASSSSYDPAATLSADLSIMIKENKTMQGIDFCIEKQGKCVKVNLPSSMSRNMAHLFRKSEFYSWDCFDFVQACSGDFSGSLEGKKSPRHFSESHWNEIKPLGDFKQSGDALQMLGKPETGTHHCAIYLGDDLYLSKIGEGITALLVTNEEELKQLYPDCNHSFKWFRTKQADIDDINSSLKIQTSNDTQTDHPSILDKSVKKLVISQLPLGAQRVDTFIDIVTTYQKHSPEKASSIIAGGIAGASIGKEIGGALSSGVCKIPIFRVYSPIIKPGFKFLGKCIGGYIGAEMGDSIGEALESVKEIKIKPVTFPPLGFPH